MLPLALTLLAASAIIMALALRGRTTARGRFCRRCKFDLQGLANPAACPECGRDITRPGATRTALRQRRPLLLVPAAACFLFALPILLSASPAVRSWLLPRLPDTALVWIDRLEIPGARDEVIARVSDPAISLPVYAPIIQRSLDRVLIDRIHAPAADRQTILAALRGAQFTDEQAERFFQAAIETRVVIRDTAHAAQSAVPSAWAFTPIFHEFFESAEMYGGVPPAYSVETAFHPGGPVDSTVLDPDTLPDDTPSAMRFLGSSRLQPNGTTGLWAPGTTPTPGAPVAVHAGLRVRINSNRSPQPVVNIWKRRTQNINIIPDDQPLIPMADDPELLAQLAAMLTTREILIVTASESIVLIAFAHTDRPSPVQTAFASTLRFADGSTFDATEHLVLAAHLFPEGSQGHANIMFQCQIDDPQAIARLRALPAGTTADIVLRADPQAAYQHAEIDQILAGEIIFREVPLRTPGPPPGGTNPPTPTMITAEVTDAASTP